MHCYGIRTAVVIGGKCEPRRVKKGISGDTELELDSAAGWVPLEAYSEMEAKMQKLYYEVLSELTPEEYK